MDLNHCTIKKDECALGSKLHSSCKLCESKQPLNISLWIVLKQIVLEVVVKNQYSDQMYWLEYKSLGSACILLSCCISVENREKKWQYFLCNFFPLATVFPLASIYNSCCLLTLPVCCHMRGDIRWSFYPSCLQLWITDLGETGSLSWWPRSCHGW